MRSVLVIYLIYSRVYVCVNPKLLIYASPQLPTFPLL